MILEIGFYSLSLVAFAMVIALLKYADHSKRLVAIYTTFGLAWLIYLVILTRTGWLESFDLPPRVPLLIVIPAIIAIIGFTGRRDFVTALERTPLHLPVFLTSFRIIVELLIYGAFRNGVFPQRVTFEGLNFDVLVGVSALVMGVLVAKGIISTRGLMIWNVLSILVLTLTVYSFVSTYYFSDYVAQTGRLDFIRFPYVLLAAVLLPIAIFLHVFSIRQVWLARGKRTDPRVTNNHIET